MGKYKIKTRNWHGKKWVLRLLNVTQKYGVWSDGERFWIETTSVVKAWCVWGYFILLRRYSGGWTYLIKPNHQLNAEYKAIY